MQSTYPHQLMACFVELSSNKERTTLEQSVVKTLCQLLGSDIRLVHLYNSRKEYAPQYHLFGSAEGEVSFDCHNIEDEPAAMAEDIKDFIDGLASYAPEEKCSREGKVYWPLFSGEQCIDLLIIEGALANDFELKLLNAIGCIFSNFLALLDASERDALTGLYNRRMFDTQLSSLVKEARSTDRSASDRRSHQEEVSHFLGIIDIDYFKRVNDDYGHLFGDEVLLWLAQNMRQCFRNEDALFRYGGEEFAVILSGLTQSQAMDTFERFRKTIETTEFPQIGRVTVSIGFSHFDYQANPTMIFGEADKALYYAKEHGRNQVHCYQQLLSKGLVNIEDAEKADIELF